MTRTRLIGCGKYLPAQVVTNNDLVARGIETSDEWIQERTGIKQRHQVKEGEYTSDLAIGAARAAMAAMLELNRNVAERQRPPL